MVANDTALTRTLALSAIEAGFTEAGKLGIPFTIAVIDGGGNLIAQVKDDRAALASIGTSLAKAVTAAHFGQPTAALQGAVGPGGPLFGLGTRDASYAFVGGGVPIVDAEGSVAGAIGVGGGNPDHDHLVASAAAAAIG